MSSNTEGAAAASYWLNVADEPVELHPAAHSDTVDRIMRSSMITLNTSQDILVRDVMTHLAPEADHGVLGAAWKFAHRQMAKESVVNQHLASEKLHNDTAQHIKRNISSAGGSRTRASRHLETLLAMAEAECDAAEEELELFNTALQTATAPVSSELQHRELSTVPSLRHLHWNMHPNAINDIIPPRATAGMDRTRLPPLFDASATGLTALPSTDMVESHDFASLALGDITPMRSLGDTRAARSRMASDGFRAPSESAPRPSPLRSSPALSSLRPTTAGPSTSSPAPARKGSWAADRLTAGTVQSPAGRDRAKSKGTNSAADLRHSVLAAGNTQGASANGMVKLGQSASAIRLHPLYQSIDKQLRLMRHTPVQGRPQSAVLNRRMGTSMSPAFFPRGDTQKQSIVSESDDARRTLDSRPECGRSAGLQVLPATGLQLMLGSTLIVDSPLALKTWLLAQLQILQQAMLRNVPFDTAYHLDIPKSLSTLDINDAKGARSMAAFATSLALPKLSYSEKQLLCRPWSALTNKHVRTARAESALTSLRHANGIVHIFDLAFAELSRQFFQECNEYGVILQTLWISSRSTTLSFTIDGLLAAEGAHGDFEAMLDCIRRNSDEVQELEAHLAMMTTVLECTREDTKGVHLDDEKALRKFLNKKLRPMGARNTRAQSSEIALQVDTAVRDFVAALQQSDEMLVYRRAVKEAERDAARLQKQMLTGSTALSLEDMIKQIERFEAEVAALNKDASDDLQPKALNTYGVQLSRVLAAKLAAQIDESDEDDDDAISSQGHDETFASPGVADGSPTSFSSESLWASSDSESNLSDAASGTTSKNMDTSSVIQTRRRDNTRLPTHSGKSGLPKSDVRPSTAIPAFSERHQSARLASKPRARRSSSRTRLKPRKSALKLPHPPSLRQLDGTSDKQADPGSRFKKVTFCSHVHTLSPRETIITVDEEELVHHVAEGAERSTLSLQSSSHSSRDQPHVPPLATTAAPNTADFVGLDELAIDEESTLMLLDMSLSSVSRFQLQHDVVALREKLWLLHGVLERQKEDAGYFSKSVQAGESITTAVAEALRRNEASKPPASVRAARNKASARASARRSSGVVESPNSEDGTNEQQEPAKPKRRSSVSFGLNESSSKGAGARRSSVTSPTAPPPPKSRPRPPPSVTEPNRGEVNTRSLPAEPSALYGQKKQRLLSVPSSDDSASVESSDASSSSEDSPSGGSSTTGGSSADSDASERKRRAQQSRRKASIISSSLLGDSTLRATALQSRRGSTHQQSSGPTAAGNRRASITSPSQPTADRRRSVTAHSSRDPKQRRGSLAHDSSGGVSKSAVQTVNSGKSAEQSNSTVATPGGIVSSSAPAVDRRVQSAVMAGENMSTSTSIAAVLGLPVDNSPLIHGSSSQKRRGGTATSSDETDIVQQSAVARRSHEELNLSNLSSAAGASDAQTIIRSDNGMQKLSDARRKSTQDATATTATSVASSSKGLLATPTEVAHINSIGFNSVAGGRRPSWPPHALGTKATTAGVSVTDAGQSDRIAQRIAQSRRSSLTMERSDLLPAQLGSGLLPPSATDQARASLGRAKLKLLLRSNAKLKRSRARVEKFLEKMMQHAKGTSSAPLRWVLAQMHNIYAERDSLTRGLLSASDTYKHDPLAICLRSELSNLTNMSHGVQSTLELPAVPGLGVSVRDLLLKAEVEAERIEEPQQYLFNARVAGLLMSEPRDAVSGVISGGRFDYFVVDVYQRRFGLEVLAQRNTFALLRGVKKFKTDLRVNTFLRLMNNKLDSTDLLFLLCVRGLTRAGIPKDAWGIVDLPHGGFARQHAIQLWSVLWAATVIRRGLLRGLQRKRKGGLGSIVDLVRAKRAVLAAVSAGILSNSTVVATPARSPAHMSAELEFASLSLTTPCLLSPRTRHSIAATQLAARTPGLATAYPFLSSAKKLMAQSIDEASVESSTYPTLSGCSFGPATAGRGLSRNLRASSRNSGSTVPRMQAAIAASGTGTGRPASTGFSAPRLLARRPSTALNATGLGLLPAAKTEPEALVMPGSSMPVDVLLRAPLTEASAPVRIQRRNSLSSMLGQESGPANPMGPPSRGRRGSLSALDYRPVSGGTTSLRALADSVRVTTISAVAPKSRRRSLAELDAEADIAAAHDTILSQRDASIPILVLGHNSKPGMDELMFASARDGAASISDSAGGRLDGSRRSRRSSRSASDLRALSAGSGLRARRRKSSLPAAGLPLPVAGVKVASRKTVEGVCAPSLWSPCRLIALLSITVSEDAAKGHFLRNTPFNVTFPDVADGVPSSSQGQPQWVSYHRACDIVHLMMMSHEQEECMTGLDRLKQVGLPPQYGGIADKWPDHMRRLLERTCRVDRDAFIGLLLSIRERSKLEFIDELLQDFKSFNTSASGMMAEKDFVSALATMFPFTFTEQLIKAIFTHGCATEGRTSGAAVRAWSADMWVEYLCNISENFLSV